MSHSLSPNNRNNLFGWVKNLKRGSLMSNESVNEIPSDHDFESKSPTKASNQTIPHIQPLSPHQEFLRPLLHHKSRSTNNVQRVRSNSLNQSEKSSSIRQHRDSFLQHNPLVDENSKYFGVPLEEAITQASAKISILSSETSDSVLQYGRIPIVVAKCGVYLKTNGLSVEGIFRVGGSSKRLKELQVIFNSPPEFGKKLKWDGYTVHDAASILRRYLNALPEPLIPLELYEEFRDPLRKRQRIINYMKFKAEYPNRPLKSFPDNPSASQDTPAEVLDSPNSQPLTEANVVRLNNTAQEGSKPTPLHQSQSDLSDVKSDTQDQTEKKKEKKSKNYRKLTRDVHNAISEYQDMVDELPNLSKQLLFYILDLLAMVQTHSQENLMSSRNLAAIFQPSILSHPNHDMDPEEYALSQSVVEFLIQYAYKLLPNQGADTRSPGAGGEKSFEQSNETKPTKLLNKPPQPLFKRRHSKSLSTNNHNDMIGFNGKRNLELENYDHDFELTDEESNIDFTSDVDDVHFQRLKISPEKTNFPQSMSDVDSGSEFNFGSIDKHLDSQEPRSPVKEVTKDEVKDVAGPAIVVSTPLRTSIPKVDV